MNIFKSLFGGNNSKDNNKESDKNKDFDILKYDGIRALHINKVAYAIKCFEGALEIKDDVETMELLANAYIAVNDHKGAIAVLEKESTLNPSEIKPLLSLASVYFLEEEYAKMNDTCNRAIAIDDNDITALYLNAKALVGLKDTIMAIAMLTKAISIKDDYIDAYLLRAKTLYSMEQITNAKEDLEHLLSIESDNEAALLLKGEIIASENRVEEAIEILDRVLSVNPFNEKAYIIKGDVLTNNKDFDRALEVYDEAIEINPQFAKAFYERGRVKLLKGDKDGSIDDMKRAMELAPESEGKIDGEFKNFDNMNKNVPW